MSCHLGEDPENSCPIILLLPFTNYPGIRIACSYLGKFAANILSRCLPNVNSLETSLICNSLCVTKSHWRCSLQMKLFVWYYSMPRLWVKRPIALIFCVFHCELSNMHFKISWILLIEMVWCLAGSHFLNVIAKKLW